jgi:hypothetical protein
MKTTDYDVLQGKVSDLGLEDVVFGATKTVSNDGSVWVVEDVDLNAPLLSASGDPIVGVVHFTRLGTQPLLRAWTSMPYENPTIADALEAFQKSIDDTGDLHHIYFEGVLVRKRVGGFTEVEIQVGS